jgi:hypothetical protein
MLKNLLSFLLLFSYLISNAQVEHSSKAIVMTVGLENYRQLFSRSEENNFNIGGPVLFKFQDGYARNVVIAYGSKKLLDNDDYHAWSIFGSGSSWERNDVFNVEDSLGNVIDQARIFAGLVNSFTVGLRYTYGLALTHNENLNFLVGFRGELHERYYSAPATEGVGFDISANKFSFRTFAVPEMQYIVPNKPYILSLSMVLPVSAFGFDSQNVKNPALTERQQKNGGAFLDLFGFNETIFELSFGFFLKS